MTKNEQLEKLKTLQASAKDLQAEFGWLCMRLSDMEERKAEIRKQLAKEEADYRAISQAPVEADASAKTAAADAADPGTVV